MEQSEASGIIGAMRYEVEHSQIEEGIACGKVGKVYPILFSSGHKRVAYVQVSVQTVACIGYAAYEGCHLLLLGVAVVAGFVHRFHKATVCRLEDFACTGGGVQTQTHTGELPGVFLKFVRLL